jgi:hypothetical protein
LLLLQEFPIESVFRQIQSKSVFSIFFSSIWHIFISILTIIFYWKLNYTNNRVYCSYYRDDYVVAQCVSRRTNPEHFNRLGLWYLCACTFSTDETINIHDLKIQIHVGLKLLLSHFNMIISAWINTAQSGSGAFL